MSSSVPYNARTCVYMCVDSELNIKFVKRTTSIRSLFWLELDLLLLLLRKSLNNNIDNNMFRKPIATREEQIF